MSRALIAVLALMPLASLASATARSADTTPSHARARDLGVPFDGTPGPLNAITDVDGVLVGHTTLIRGQRQARRRQGPGAHRGHGRAAARRRLHAAVLLRRLVQ